MLIVEKENKHQFDMSLVQSFSEKPLMRNKCVVRRMLHLNMLYGLFFLTDKNIYFQSFHSVSTKPVKVIPINNIKGLFRRRFELRSIGMECKTERKNNKSYYFVFN